MSRNRVNNSLRENRRFKKDLKVSISLLSMNLLFIILNLPDEIDLFLPYNDLIYQPLAQLCNLSFAINFYLILFTNRLFRTEFLSIFRSRKAVSTQPMIRELKMKHQTVTKRNVESTL
jgi:hypothetical protein